MVVTEGRDLLELSKSEKLCFAYSVLTGRQLSMVVRAFQRCLMASNFGQD